jgi:hypothetical protein
VTEAGRAGDGHTSCLACFPLITESTPDMLPRLRTRNRKQKQYRPSYQALSNCKPITTNLIAPNSLCKSSRVTEAAPLPAFACAANGKPEPRNRRQALVIKQASRFRVHQSISNPSIFEDTTEGAGRRLASGFPHSEVEILLRVMKCRMASAVTYSYGKRRSLLRI